MEEDFIDDMTFELDPNRYVRMGGRQFQAEGTAKQRHRRKYGFVGNSKEFCTTWVQDA